MSKTIKVIDLLNKIANGEEVPKKIKWRDKIWDYWEGTQDYTSKQGIWFTSNLNEIRTKDFVNDTVEIIEEEPEIDIQGIEELDEDIASSVGEISCGWTFNEQQIVKQQNKIVRAIKKLDNQINNK